MHLASSTLLLCLLTLATTSPISHQHRRQAAVLQSQTYSQFQVSDGVAGSALDEVNAAFPVANLDPAVVSDDDIQRLKDARVIAEDAEVGTGGFNEQIDAAEAAGQDTTALQNGKIKNKVLKLQLQVLVLEIQAAQGNPDNAKLQEQLTKLNNNIQQDEDAAGEASVGVGAQFSGAQESD